MIEAGEKFAREISQMPEAVVVELVGDVGTGKTTFTRGLARGLGILDPVTSPSFTISKTYAIPHGGVFSHYDFYRLSDPGLMQEDLEESFLTSKITVIEWADSVEDILPPNRLKLKISLKNDG